MPTIEPERWLLRLLCTNISPRHLNYVIILFSRNRLVVSINGNSVASVETRMDRML